MRVGVIGIVELGGGVGRWPTAGGGGRIVLVQVGGDDGGAWFGVGIAGVGGAVGARVGCGSGDGRAGTVAGAGKSMLAKCGPSFAETAFRDDDGGDSAVLGAVLNVATDEDGASGEDGASIGEDEAAV